MRITAKVLLLTILCSITISQVSGQGRHEREQINFLFNQAVNEYNQKKYASSAENFTKLLDITDKYYLDSVAVYYCGLASMKAKMNDQAIEQFSRCIENEYMTEKSIFNIASIKKKTESNQAYIETLQEGLEIKPNSTFLLGHILDYYIESEQLGKAESYVEQLISLTPDDAKLYYTKAAIYSEEGNFEESNRFYQKAIELNPEYFDALFSLGANYFNKGVESYEKMDANENTDPEAEDTGNYIRSFKNAMTYMEKAYELKPNDESLLEALQDIYSLMQSEEEVYKTCYEEITKKINGDPNNFVPSESYATE